MESSYTKRVTSDALENILYEKHSVLNHGFIRVVDYMGSDQSIVQAARVSYGKGTKHLKQDEALINYLMCHSHSTPFEMCEIKFHIKLPIFVARQWLRHRTANVNEYSARYSILDKEFYVPRNEDVSKQSNSNFQGRGEVLDDEFVKEFTQSLYDDSNLVYENYDKFLEKGLSRELARVNLTLNYYTQLYWKIDLHNLLHFIKLRSDKHAQYEIRVYSDAILEIIKQWVPLTYNAFIEYSLEAKNISKNGLNVIRSMIKGNKVTFEDSNLTKREWNELISTLSDDN